MYVNGFLYQTAWKNVNVLKQRKTTRQTVLWCLLILCRKNLCLSVLNDGVVSKLTSVHFFKLIHRSVGPIFARIRQWNSAWQHMFVWGQRPRPVTQRGPNAAKFLGLSYVSDLWESTFLRTQAHPYQNGRGHSAPSFRTLQLCALIITLRTKLSSAVYCNRSCLFVCLFVCGSVRLLPR